MNGISAPIVAVESGPPLEDFLRSRRSVSVVIAAATQP